jgi:hypothetical protein
VARRKDGPVILSPEKWAPLGEAFLQIKARVGSSEPAERDMTRGLRNGDLAAATRELGHVRDREGTYIEKDEIIIRRRSFWQDYAVQESFSAGGARVPDLPRGMYVFIRRDKLDKHYPRELPAATQPDNARATTGEPRRKPGKPPDHNWPMAVARDLIRRARVGEPMPTAPDMLQWCEDNWGWQPDIRQMQRLLRDLLS